MPPRWARRRTDCRLAFAPRALFVAFRVARFVDDVAFVDLRGAPFLVAAVRRVVLRPVTRFAVFRTEGRFAALLPAARLAVDRPLDFDFFAGGIVSPRVVVDDTARLAP